MRPRVRIATARRATRSLDPCRAFGAPRLLASQNLDVLIVQICIALIVAGGILIAAAFAGGA